MLVSGLHSEHSKRVKDNSVLLEVIFHRMKSLTLVLRKGQKGMNIRTWKRRPLSDGSPIKKKN